MVIMAFDITNCSLRWIMKYIQVKWIPGCCDSPCYMSSILWFPDTFSYYTFFALSLSFCTAECLPFAIILVNILVCTNHPQNLLCFYTALQTTFFFVLFSPIFYKPLPRPKMSRLNNHSHTSHYYCSIHLGWFWFLSVLNLADFFMLVHYDYVHLRSLFSIKNPLESKCYQEDIRNLKAKKMCLTCTLRER